MKHSVQCGMWGPDSETCIPNEDPPDSEAVCKDSTAKDKNTCVKAFDVWNGKCEPGWGEVTSFPACESCLHRGGVKDCWSAYVVYRLFICVHQVVQDTSRRYLC